MIAICKRQNWIARGLRLLQLLEKDINCSEDSTRPRGRVLHPVCHHLVTGLPPSAFFPVSANNLSVLGHSFATVLPPFCQQLNTTLIVVCHYSSAVLPTFCHLYANIFASHWHHFITFLLPFSHHSANTIPPFHHLSMTILPSLCQYLPPFCQHSPSFCHHPANNKPHLPLF